MATPHVAKMSDGWQARFAINFPREALKANQELYCERARRVAVKIEREDKICNIVLVHLILQLNICDLDLAFERAQE